MYEDYNFHAVKDRIGIVPKQWNFPLSDQYILDILQKIGFVLIKANPYRAARSVVDVSNFKRVALLNQAPQIFSCSSFIGWMYSHLGIELPIAAIDKSKLGIDVEIKQLMPGDLVFAKGWIPQYDIEPSKGIGHVGIVSEQGTILHSTNRHPVYESTLIEFCKDIQYFRGAKRILPEQGFYTLKIPDHLDINWSDDVKRKIYKFI